jgi:hypothetical protein
LQKGYGIRILLDSPMKRCTEAAQNMCDVGLIGPILFFPPHPIPPLPSLRRIEFLTVETRHELLRVGI